MRVVTIPFLPMEEAAALTVAGSFAELVDCVVSSPA